MKKSIKNIHTLPQSDEYDTIAGLPGSFEDIPKKDDVIKIENFTFTIRDVNKTKIQVELLIYPQFN